MLTQYFASVTKLLEDTEEAVRKAALQTTSLALKQGLVHPLSCVSQLLCLLADRQPIIANKAFAIVTAVIEKSPECVWTRLAAAIPASYHFQRSLWKDAKSVLWESDDKPGESLYGRLFALGKKQRAATRSLRLAFLAAAIKAFDVPLTGAGATGVNLDLLRYVAEALGYLSFTNIEEPLCLIYHINRLLAFKGEPTLAAIKTAKTDADAALAQHAGSVTLLILLKNFLKQTYALTESKCKSYMPGAASATAAPSDLAAPALSKAEKEKEKEVQVNAELRKKPSPLGALPAEPKALLELFKKTMKADTSDTLTIAAQPTGKVVRKKAAKRAAGKDEDAAATAAAPAKKRRGGAKGRGRRARAADSDSEGSDDVSSAPSAAAAKSKAAAARAHRSADSDVEEEYQP